MMTGEEKLDSQFLLKAHMKILMEMMFGISVKNSIKAKDKQILLPLIQKIQQIVSFMHVPLIGTGKTKVKKVLRFSSRLEIVHMNIQMVQQQLPVHQHVGFNMMIKC